VSLERGIMRLNPVERDLIRRVLVDVVED